MKAIITKIFRVLKKLFILIARSAMCVVSEMKVSSTHNSTSRDDVNSQRRTRAMKSNAQSRFSVRAKFKTDCAIEVICMDSETNTIFGLNTLIIHKDDVKVIKHSKKFGDELVVKGWPHRIMRVTPSSPLIYVISVRNLDTNQVTIITWDILAESVSIEHKILIIDKYHGDMVSIATYQKCISEEDLIIDNDVLNTSREESNND